MTAELRRRALAVLEANHRDGYTVPAQGLYPYQWCWDSGPIALGWAAAGRWDEAWSELDAAAVRPVASGHGAPHRVLEPGRHLLPRARRLGDRPQPADYGADPATVAGQRRRPALRGRPGPRPGRSGHPRPVAPAAGLAGVDRAGPLAVPTEPASSCIRGSPGWTTHPRGISPSPPCPRRPTCTSSAATWPPCRPSNGRPRASTASISASSRRFVPPAGTPNASRRTVPFAVEDPSFTAITARAAADLAAVADQAGLDASEPGRLAERRPGRTRRPVGRRARLVPPLRHPEPKPQIGPATSTGLVALYAGVAEDRTAPHDGPARRLDPSPRRRDPDHRPGGSVVRPHPLLARPGVGAGQLVGRRRAHAAPAVPDGRRTGPTP